jgi:hypothetical protein
MQSGKRVAGIIIGSLGMLLLVVGAVLGLLPTNTGGFGPICGSPFSPNPVGAAFTLGACDQMLAVPRAWAIALLIAGFIGAVIGAILLVSHEPEVQRGGWVIQYPATTSHQTTNSADLSNARALYDSGTITGEELDAIKRSLQPGQPD